MTALSELIFSDEPDKASRHAGEPLAEQTKTIRERVLRSSPAVIVTCASNVVGNF